METKNIQDSQIDLTFFLEIQGSTDGVLFHQVYNGDPPSRIIHQTENFIVLCDIAPLTLGHLIIIPKWPWASFGKMPSEQWDELLGLKKAVSVQLTNHYSKPVFLEHGSCSSMTGGACVTHAHLHAVPCPMNLDMISCEGLLFEKIQAMNQLTILGQTDLPYIFFEDLNNDMYVSKVNTKIRRQFIRIEIAKSLGIQDPYWDWGVSINKPLLRQTVKDLAKESW